jgi:beta-lactamase regulating signal transducer with metallopeptidase domain
VTHQALTILANGMIISSLAAATLWLLFRASRNSWNATTREAAWWTVLLLTISIPLLDAGVSQLRSLRAAPMSNAGNTRDSAAPAEAASLQPLTSRERMRQADQAAAETTGVDPTLPLRVSAERWPSWIAGIWLVTSMLMLARLFVSYLALERRKSRALEAPAELVARLRQWTGLLDRRRTGFRLAISTDINGPVAAGPFRPAILIPARLLQQLEDSELEEISLHEAAHLARRDDYWLLLQRIIEALFVFHPVVRWITRRIDLEREIACDDVVIRATGRPRSYAWCLTRLAELSGNISAAVPATQRRSHLERRVDMLLNDTRKKDPFLLKLRLAGVFGAVVALLSIVAANAPGIVVFAQPNQSASVAVRIPVLVTDSKDRYISGLEAHHFIIRENGVQQEISEFLEVPGPQQAKDAYSVVIIVNPAGSRQALNAFLSGFRPSDEYTIRVNRPAFSLLENVRTGVTQLRSAQNPRRAILIVSDGSIYPGAYAEDQLKMVAAESDVPIYAISTVADAAIGAPLNVLTTQTGGRYFAQQDAWDRAAVAMRNFYVLTFQSKNGTADGNYRSLEVEVVPPRGIQALQAHHRAFHLPGR